MRLTVGLAACLLLVAAEGKGKKGDDLTGVWKVSNLTFAGGDQDGWKGLKFTFKGTKLVHQTPEGEATYTYKLDGSKKPAEVDLVAEDGENKGKTLKGIYTVKDGELKVCVPLSADIDRPKEFASKDGEQIALVVLKKDKP
jgi:uncharacterized protein (TIGR03067 family)